MKPMVRNERGMALALAMVALVVVGLLVAGAMFVGTQEQRVGENQRRVGQSFGIAEAALLEASNPDSLPAMRYSRLGVYPGASPSDTLKFGWWPNLTPAPGGTGSYGGYMVKLNQNLYFMDMVASDRASQAASIGAGGGARQRLGMLMRIRPVRFPMQASLTTQGSVALKGQATVDGFDQNPGGWTDCAPLGPPDSNKAGVRTSGTGTVNVSGAGGVYGNPDVVKDATVADSTFTQFGDMLWNDLVGAANVRLPAGTYTTQPSYNADGSCRITDVLNWGDGMNKASRCGNYFPIIHVTGSSTLNNVQGQGILLVDGDLNIQGSYNFFGITIIQGALKTSGGGNTEAHFWGMTMARSLDFETQGFSGKAELNYSKCAIIDALQGSNAVSPMRSRGWSQLYQ